jgi:hypothetical protein
MNSHQIAPRPVTPWLQIGNLVMLIALVLLVFTAVTLLVIRYEAASSQPRVEVTSVPPAFEQSRDSWYLEP